MKIEQTLEELLPKKLLHVKLSLISFYSWAGFVILALWVFLLFRDTINEAVLYFSIAAYLIYTLAMTFSIKRIRTKGNNETINFFQKWADEKYGLTLEESQARILIEPAGYRNLKKRYISEPLEIWTEDDLKRKHVQTLRLVKPPENDFVIMHMETATELTSRVEQEELAFFQNMWTEVSINGGLFGLYDDTKEFEVLKVQQGLDQVALLWSDPLHAQLYNTGNSNHKIVHIELTAFLQQFLPQQAQRGVLLGLNWGEEQRVYSTEKIAELIQ